MAKVINIRKPVIDIEFKDDNGNLVAEFEFDKSDDAAQRILDTQNEMLAELVKAENDDDYSLKKLGDTMRKIMDNLLHEGAYDTLYEISPSWEIMLYYFIEICKAISEETNSNLSEMNTAIEKYINK